MDEPLFSIRYANDACPLVVLPDELLPYWEGSGPPGDPDGVLDFSGTDYERALSADYLVDVLPVGPGQGLVLGAQTDMCNPRWMLLPDAPGLFVLIPMDCPEGGELQVPGMLAATAGLEWKTVCESFTVSGDTLAMFTCVSPGDDLTIRQPSFKPLFDDWEYAAMMDCIQCPIRPGIYSVEYAELRFEPSSSEPGIVVCRFRPHEAAGDSRDLARRAPKMTGLGPPPTYNVASAFIDLLERHRLTHEQEEEATGAVEWLRTLLAETFPGAEPPDLIGAYAHGTVVDPSELIDVLFPADALAVTGDLRSDSGRLVRHIGEQLAASQPSDVVRVEGCSIRLRRGSHILNLLPGLHREPDGYLVPDGQGGWLARNPAFHTTMLEASDRQERGTLKPLIRLLKVWNRANGSLLSGLHLALVIDASTRAMRQHPRGPGIPRFGFGSGASDINTVPWVLVVGAVIQSMTGYLSRPFPDPWTEGAPIDAYLSPASRERVLALLVAHDQAARDAARMQIRGPYEGAFERWQSVYNGVFPAMR